MAQAQFEKRPVLFDTHASTFCERGIYKELKIEALREDRRAYELITEGADLIVKVRRGELIVTPATPQEDSK